MVDLAKENIQDLELIGQGTFGKVYKIDDKIYKLYHKQVKTRLKGIAKNPSLKYKYARLNRMINLNRKLKYNDLIEDLIFEDGKFKGIVRPYYEGVLLSQTMDFPLEDKIEIAYKILRNSKELTKHFVYPLDYKLNNMILTSDDVRFLDLDDPLTKVDVFLNPIHKNSCIKGLDETIKTYFNEYKTLVIPKEIAEKLKRKRELLSSDYDGIEIYINRKKIKNNYIVINDIADINANIELLRNSDYRKVYVYKNENLEELVNFILNLGIDLYDLVSVYDIENYMNSFLYDICLELKDEKIRSLKK